MSISLGLRGWEEFRRFLKEFGPRVKTAMDEAAEDSSKLIAQSAKKKAPVRTGKLRKSLGPDRFMIRAGTDYSSLVEFGTRKMKAQPFLRPAISESIGKVRNIFRSKIEDSLRRGLR